MVGRGELRREQLLRSGLAGMMASAPGGSDLNSGPHLEETTPRNVYTSRGPDDPGKKRTVTLPDDGCVYIPAGGVGFRVSWEWPPAPAAV